MKGRGFPTESQGVTRNNSRTNRRSEVKMMRPDSATTKDSEASERSQVVVDQAVEQVVATMHNIKSDGTLQNVAMGLTPMSEKTLDSSPVKALLDTGSSISIVSLEFNLSIAAKGQRPNQTPTEWGKEVRHKLKPTIVSLRSYGGEEPDIVSQVSCHLERDGYQVKAMLQVQKGAPVHLLFRLCSQAIMDRQRTC